MPNFWKCPGSRAEKAPSLRRRANGTRFDHMTAWRFAMSGKPAQRREHCKSLENPVPTSDHLLPAFSQNASCDQHVKYPKSDDPIRFSYEVPAALFGGFAHAAFHRSRLRPMKMGTFASP